MTLNSTSTMAQTLGGELLEGQRKPLSLGIAGENLSALNPLVSQLSITFSGLHEKICSVFLITCWFFNPVMRRSICGYQMSLFCFYTSFIWLY